MYSTELKVLQNGKINNESVLNLLKNLEGLGFSGFCNDLINADGVNLANEAELSNHLFFMRDLNLIEFETKKVNPEKNVYSFTYPRVTAKGHNHIKLWENNLIVNKIIDYTKLSINEIPFELLMVTAAKVIKSIELKEAV
mgnify:CR=1 FL=1